MCLIINAHINKEILQINNNFISHKTREEHVKPKVFRGKKIKKIREELHKIEKRKKNRDQQKQKLVLEKIHAIEKHSARATRRQKEDS